MCPGPQWEKWGGDVTGAGQRQYVEASLPEIGTTLSSHPAGSLHHAYPCLPQDSTFPPQIPHSSFWQVLIALIIPSITVNRSEALAGHVLLIYPVSCAGPWSGRNSVMCLNVSASQGSTAGQVMPC